MPFLGDVPLVYNTIHKRTAIIALNLVYIVGTHSQQADQIQHAGGCGASRHTECGACSAKIALKHDIAIEVDGEIYNLLFTMRQAVWRAGKDAHVAFLYKTVLPENLGSASPLKLLWALSNVSLQLLLVCEAARWICYRIRTVNRS